jgi:hypothetical protein
MSVQNVIGVQNFIKKENIDTIWDVIIDEDIFKFLTREIQVNVLKLFNENIKGFFDVERIKTSKLVEMNKKYILLILNHIKKNYPNNMPSKIKIFNDSETKEPITYEEIQNEKKTQFEMELMKKQQEFTNSMSLQVPEVPDFKDNFTDEPISEMDKMIKEITAKRNYDVEQINRSYQQGSVENADTWLKPQETSVKSEKLTPNISQHIIQETNSRSKYQTIEDTEVQKNKNVSWGQNEEYNIPSLSDEMDEDNNIFNKLKKIPSNLQNITLTMNENTEERLTHIEKTLYLYNSKIDKILDLLQNKDV